MSLRNVLVACLLLGAVGWWLAPAPGSVPAGFASNGLCPLPPASRPGQPPLQSRVPGSVKPFVLESGSVLTPLAGFSAEARVLSRKDYRAGREAQYSPIDLALGWDRMADDEVLDQLSISQSGRWDRYRWEHAPPLPLEQIIVSSANMHMIPANESVARALAKVGKDDRVHLHGWLVEIQAQDGWRWRSSTRRDDSGEGACELVYVCAISRQ